MGTYIFAAHVILWQNVSNGQAMDDCSAIAVNGATVGYSGGKYEFVEERLEMLHILQTLILVLKYEC